MNDSKQMLPEQTLECMARGFYKESIHYGFNQLDYVRFVNMLLDLSMHPDGEQGLANLDESRPENMEDCAGSKTGVTLPVLGEKTGIRVFDAASDTGLLKKWLGDKSGQEFLLSRHTARTINLDQLLSDKHNIFGIVTTPDGSPVGCVAYLGYSEDQNHAELRKLIGNPAMRGLGLAKEATQLWIDYGVSALGIKKIQISTLNTNINNIRLNEDLGFKVEGILRNEICVDGVYLDVLRMGLWTE